MCETFVLVWIAIGQVAYKELMSKRGAEFVICRSKFNVKHLNIMQQMGVLITTEEERPLPSTRVFHSGDVIFRHKSIQKYFAGLYYEFLVKNKGNIF